MHLNHCRCLPPANEVWCKVIFSQAYVKNSVHGGGGVLVPGECLVPEGEVPGSGECLVPEGEVPGLEGCLVETPLTGRLLPRAVRILLECILVGGTFKYMSWLRVTLRYDRVSFP